MKKLFAMLMALVILPVSCFAISLDELQRNSNRYISVTQTKDASYYVDINSIKSLRSVEPYYTLQATVYWVEYNTPRIWKTITIINYNNNRSASTITSEAGENIPGMTDEQFINYLMSELNRDCGIYNNECEVFQYGFNGENSKRQRFDALTAQKNGNQTAAVFALSL